MSHHPDSPPQIEVNGSLCYIPQHPWVLNASLKDNIVCDGDFDSARYSDAVKYSLLQSDLDVMINGDDTEIGEKGINLSGGQKSRVSLARALYKNTDIYLLDDPLSAVDAHVGNFILNECILGYLKDKTRVLVTHNSEILKHADYVYVLKGGRIVESGSYQTLRNITLFNKIMDEKNAVLNEQEIEATEDKTEDASVKFEQQGDIKEENKSVEDKDQEYSAQLPKKSTEVAKDVKRSLEQKLMLTEDREVGIVSRKVWMSYFRSYGGIGYVLLVVFAMLCWVSLQTGSNIWLSHWSDTSSEFIYSKEFYLGVYCALGVSQALFFFLRSILLTLQSIKTSRVIHRNMIQRVIRAPLNLFFDRVPIGRLLNRFSRDLQMLDDIIARRFGYFLTVIFSVLADLAVCIIVGTFWILPISLLTLCICYQFQKKFMILNREVTRLESISKSPILSLVSESLHGLTLIRAHKDEGKFCDKFHKLQDESIKNLILSTCVSNWFGLRVTVCSILIMAPALAIPIIFNVGNMITPGMIGILITYTVQINDDILCFLDMISDFESRLVAFERCKVFTEIEGEAISKTERTNLPNGFDYRWPSNGTVEFTNYSVKYRPDLPLVVKDLSVKIHSGEKIGVVGRTGSGKSTLFLSLLRIIEPTTGVVYIDGVNITKIGLDDLRRKITIIPQDPILFEGTIRSNLDPLSQYTDEDLWKSLEKVSLRGKFEQVDGLSTKIKEAGGNLSAGERQLLCIGRAILTGSRIILMDEATSSVDAITEQNILQAISTSFEDCTIITIAHRLETIVNSDRILVMGDGKMLEFAEPKVLLGDENGHFYKLWSEHLHSKRNKKEILSA